VCWSRLLIAVQITDDHLAASIKDQNETRSLFQRLYGLRKGDAPPISGSDVLKIFLASVSMPVDAFNRLLKELLADLENSTGISDYRARIMKILAGCQRNTTLVGGTPTRPV
jgi:benzoyl-CoA reductase/2-hydroxyglutaryl-CoA dehydratase subunit BcrC/BadD/HgdB